MLRRPPRSTRTDPHFPYTTLFRSDLLPERRSAPVGDAFLAAAGREKALPFGAGQPFDVGLCIPMRLADDDRGFERSEEHTSELQSLMRISYAVFCLKKKIRQYNKHNI